MVRALGAVVLGVTLGAILMTLAALVLVDVATRTERIAEPMAGAIPVVMATLTGAWLGGWAGLAIRLRPHRPTVARTLFVTSGSVPLLLGVLPPLMTADFAGLFSAWSLLLAVPAAGVLAYGIRATRSA